MQTKGKLQIIDILHEDTGNLPVAISCRMTSTGFLKPRFNIPVREIPLTNLTSRASHPLKAESSRLGPSTTPIRLCTYPRHAREFVFDDSVLVSGRKQPLL
jgi:hypothetical protein